MALIKEQPPPPPPTSGYSVYCEHILSLGLLSVNNESHSANNESQTKVIRRTTKVIQQTTMTGKSLAFWMVGCLWEVVAYARWSHMEI